MHDLTRAQKALYIAAGISLAAGIFFEFVPVGYRMSALVFLALTVWLALFALFSRRNTRVSRVMRALLALAIVIGLPLFLVAEIPVLRDARGSEDTTAPWLIVCGAGVNGSTPSRSMTDRLERALVWMDENPDSTVILSGGQGPGEDVSEAQAMYDWLAERGVDTARLLLEDKSASSYENLVNSLAIIQANGGDTAGKIAILSSEYHLHRLGWMAKKLGCQPVLVPARTTKFSLFLNYAIREACAMWRFWLLGMK